MRLHYALSAFLLTVSFSAAAPYSRRGVALNMVAVPRAQKGDNTTFEIKTSSGECLAADPAKGKKLTHINAVKCNGGAGQLWDVVKSGKQNLAQVIHSSTNTCIHFHPHRKAADQVLLERCANSTRAVPSSELFEFPGAGPFPLVPQNGKNRTCLAVNKSNRLLEATACKVNKPAKSDLFTSVGSVAAPTSASSRITTSTSSHATISAQTTTSLRTTPPPASVCTPTATANTTTSLSTKVPPASTSSPATTRAKTTTSLSATVSTSSSTTAPAQTTHPTTVPPASTSTTKTATVISVSGARGVLDPSAVAQAQQRDDTAVRAFSSAQIKTADRRCLTVNPPDGDFRENLIPIQIKACDGSAGQKWDVITLGIHNNVKGTALIVSALTQGAINFDPRRNAGNQVLIFSAGGRGDGTGEVATSQLFPFSGGTGPLALRPLNGDNHTCLIANNATNLLDDTPCTPSTVSVNELFTFVT